MEVPRQCETPKWSPVEPFSALGRVPVRSFSGLFIRFRKVNSRNFAPDFGRWHHACGGKGCPPSAEAGGRSSGMTEPGRTDTETRPFRIDIPPTEDRKSV